MTLWDRDDSAQIALRSLLVLQLVLMRAFGYSCISESRALKGFLGTA
jgi:hypothetical protein